MALSANFPRALVHAPLSYQGLGLPNLWITQGIVHCLKAVVHGLHDSITGKLLRCTLESLIVELGRPGFPFESHIGRAADYLSPTLRRFRRKPVPLTSWWVNTWQFLSRFGLFLHTPNIPTLDLLRRNDRFLMPAFEQEGFRGDELARLSRCRLYLQVHTLSDITDGSGVSIESWACLGFFHPLRENRSTCRWPPQPRPPAIDWRFWAQALSRTFQLQSNRILPASLQLGL